MKNTFCASENGKNEVIANIEWTTGFLTDMPCLAYEYTGDVKYRALGRRQLGTFNPCSPARERHRRVLFVGRLLLALIRMYKI